MQIDGMVEEKLSANNGIEVHRFWPEGKSKYRHIKVQCDASNEMTAEFIEGNAVPGLETGEVIHIKNCTRDIAERVVRAMAKIHLNVDDAMNGYTEVDVELLQRGFNVSRVNSVVTVWERQDGYIRISITRPDDRGIPASMKDEVYALIEAPHQARIRVHADNIQSLFAYLDTEHYMHQMRPNFEYDLTVIEARLN